jgi:transposase
MEKKVEIPELIDGRRRRWTVEQKRALLAEAEKPGESISAVGRRYGVAPSMMFQWRRAMNEAGNEGLKSNEKVVPESEVKRLKARIAELERALGRKTVDNEILEAAVELAVEKKLISPKHLPRKRGGR